MIVLGLGSNIGDRLTNLRRALSYLRHASDITVKNISSVYESEALLRPEMPEEWSKPFFNVAISCESSLSPSELLARVKDIEVCMGRVERGRWAPRCIDIDILVWEGVCFSGEELSIPHSGLLDRPFALWPLVDLFPDYFFQKQNKTAQELAAHWGSRFDGNAPCKTKQTPFRLDLPVIVGVLNLTSDSFSNGNQFNTTELAFCQAKKMFAEGAEVIDIGAVSTRPYASKVIAKREWVVINDLLKALKSYWSPDSFQPKLSIDTYNYQVAERAIEAGVDWINDQTAFSDEAMRTVVKNSSVNLVFMHCNVPQ